MATETTKDAVIVAPPQKLNKIDVVETASGTDVIFKARTAGAKVTVGNDVTTKGKSVLGSKFTFADGGSLTVDNNIGASQVKGSADADSLKFTGLVANVQAKMGAGADSVTFQGATVRNVDVDLGKGDGAADVVTIDDFSKVSKLRLTSFGQNDKLVINGKTFSAEDLNGKNFGDKLTIKFD